MSLHQLEVVETRDRSHSPSTNDYFIKTTISNIKNSNIIEKTELQRLNVDLKNYLDSARALEAANAALVIEVNKAKEAYRPAVMDKTELDAKLAEVRASLEAEAKGVGKFAFKSEELQCISDHINQRLRFFQTEVDVQAHRIEDLQAYLYSIQSQKDYLISGAKTVAEQITMQKGVIEKYEADLDGLRKQLTASRGTTQKSELEVKTLFDQLSFVKAVFNEEINSLRGRSGRILIEGDLSGFYRDEINIAIRQIRDDFANLNEQQLSEYQKYKEAELLALHKQEEEQATLYAKKQHSRLAAAAGAEQQVTAELNEAYQKNQRELVSLGATNRDLQAKLDQLTFTYNERSRNGALALKEAEIRELKATNAAYVAEMDYWERVTREKLESEIMTYRVILRTQMKLMNTAVSLKHVIENVKTVETRPAPIISVDLPKFETHVPRVTSYVPAEIEVRKEIKVPKVEVYVPPTRDIVVTRDRKVYEPRVAASYSYAAPRLDIHSTARPTSYSYTAPRYETTSSYRTTTPRLEASVTVPRFEASYTAPRVESRVETTSGTTSYSAEFAASLRRVFNHFDTDHSGTISSSELRNILRWLSIDMTEASFQDLFRDIDRDGNRQLDFNEFGRILGPIMNGRFEDEELLFAFRKYDNDNSGSLSAKELSKVFAKLDIKYSDKQVAEVIANASNRRDGTITFNEFRQLMKGPSTYSVEAPRVSVSVRTPEKKLGVATRKRSIFSFGHKNKEETTKF